MPVHDFYCYECETLEKDVFERETEKACPTCGGIMHITYSHWEKVALINDGVSVNDRVARDGTISKLGASDSKLARIEMGLSSSLHDKGLRTTSPEQAAELRAKMIAAGTDAVANRRLLEDVIDMRKKNTAKV
jgi:hypothetical protein